ncbi:hypothetical protein JYL57_001931 [Salmonella enterica subsp. enterica serovar Typhimurium]|nr:hypothetical protein [Salmonella enterica subsp. enterica serovar Typhimurium]
MMPLDGYTLPARFLISRAMIDNVQKGEYMKLPEAWPLYAKWFVVWLVIMPMVV